MRKNNVNLRVLSILLIAATVFCAFPFFGFALSDEEQAAQLKDKINSIQNKIETNEDRIAALKKQANKKKEYINELQAQVDDIQDKIDLMNEGIAAVQKQIDKVDAEITDIENEINELKAQIDRLENQILKKQQQIAQTYTLLGQRIRALYLAGPTSGLEMFLSEDSFEFETFLAQLELFDRITEHDHNLVESIKADIESIKEMQSEIEGSIKERDAAAAKLEGKKTELDQKKQEKVDARNEVQAEENKVQADMNEIIGYVRTLNAQSAEYQKINDAAEDKIAAYEDQIVELLRGDSSSGSGKVSSGMSWPLRYSNTYISSSYKMRTLNGRTKLHKGIDICCDGGTYGKTISAAAGGKVIAAYHSGYNGGYGLYIVIDHGDGVQTYYAHCSSVYVNKGQTVSKGDSIGAVGNSGYSFGAHLHFGVCVNGTFVNPLNYVSKPAGCEVRG